MNKDTLGMIEKRNKEGAREHYGKVWDDIMKHDWAKTDKEVKELAALDSQVAGSHYKDMNIQPIEFIQANNISYAAGNIIKYACRYKHKNKEEDIKKIIHYCRLILELEYGEKNVN